MDKIKYFLERAIYDGLGINNSAYNVDKEINKLKFQIPPRYLKRDVTDLGCGDGKVSMQLKQVLLPNTFRGIDRARKLINKAKKNGLNQAEVGDIENENVSGDLGVLWGVLHHMQNPVKVLQALKRNFKSLIIRESVNKNRMMELGRHKLNMAELYDIYREAGVENHIKDDLYIHDNQTSIVFMDFTEEKK